LGTSKSANCLGSDETIRNQSMSSVNRVRKAFQTPFLAAAIAVGVLAPRVGAVKERDVVLVWFGGSDCPPCVAWRSEELPKLRLMDEFRGVRFIHVEKPVMSAIPPSLFLPVEVKEFKAKLDVAGAGRSGSPQVALIVDGEVYDFFRRVRSAREIADMLSAVRGNGKYPFNACVRVGAQGHACALSLEETRAVR